MNLTTKHITVKGKVQGVFFRKHTKQIADKLHIKGWVKNTGEGHVEILAHAAEDAVAKLVEWCWQGSPKANVTEVIIKDADNNNNFKNFLIYRE